MFINDFWKGHINTILLNFISGNSMLFTLDFQLKMLRLMGDRTEEVFTKNPTTASKWIFF